METTTPPLTPSRQYPPMSPLDTTSPRSSQLLRRRTSSFSSNHDRSPVSVRKNRFSNASQYSTDFSPDGGAGLGIGMGNLADELDQLDDDVEEDEDTAEAVVVEEGGDKALPSPVDGARDSGIDVSYNTASKKHSPRSMRNFSKPFLASLAAEKPPDSETEDDEDAKLSPDLEDAMNNIARMTSYTSTAEDPLIPRTVALLQDLGNQSNLETHAHRLTTSTNSVTAHLTTQSKALQALTAQLYSPLTIFSAPLDPVAIEETSPLIETLLTSLPRPDLASTQGLQKLDRETDNVVHTLSTLTDTIQMGRQITNQASRHLRTTQAIVAELRRERERADAAREALGREVRREGRCKQECADVMSGFEATCEGLRESLIRQSNSADVVVA